MIQVEDLGKRFGERWALQSLGFQVARGSFLGVLGRNGAGKTTLVRLLTGQLSPDAGLARVAGLEVTRRSLELRRRMGVMPEAGALLEGLTGLQYLGFVGRLHGLGLDDLESRIRELGALLDMDFNTAPIAEYSFGMKKKTALAASFLHGPEILFLDEPFEGLDPVTSVALQGLLSDLHARGTTIVLTSHQLGLAERLCDHFLVVDEGRILAHGPAPDLLKGDETLEGLFLRLVGRKELTWCPGSARTPHSITTLTVNAPSRGAQKGNQDPEIEAQKRTAVRIFAEKIRALITQRS